MKRRPFPKRYPRDIRFGEQIRVRFYRIGWQWRTVAAIERSADGHRYNFILLEEDGSYGGQRMSVASNSKHEVR